MDQGIQLNSMLRTQLNQIINKDPNSFTKFESNQLEHIIAPFIQKNNLFIKSQQPFPLSKAINPNNINIKINNRYSIGNANEVNHLILFKKQLTISNCYNLIIRPLRFDFKQFQFNQDMILLTLQKHINNYLLQNISYYNNQAQQTNLLQLFNSINKSVNKSDSDLIIQGLKGQSIPRPVHQLKAISELNIQQQIDQNELKNNIEVMKLKRLSSIYKYNSKQKQECIQRYLRKKKNRMNTNRIRYSIRKDLALKRERVKGKFVKIKRQNLREAAIQILGGISKEIDMTPSTISN